jgi:hypothetical protein
MVNLNTYLSPNFMPTTGCRCLPEYKAKQDILYTLSKYSMVSVSVVQRLL